MPPRIGEFPLTPSESSRLWRERHPERAAESRRKFIAGHPNACSEASAKYKANNLEKRRALDAAHQAKMRKENPEHHKGIALRWREKNRAALATRQREYRIKFPDVVKKTRRDQDLKNRLNPRFRLHQALRSGCRRACIYSGNRKSKRTIEIVGAEVSVVKDYIQSLFKPGMSFDNYGEWQIDHIIPLATAKSIDHAYALCHYTNLQPLWKHENLMKSDSTTTTQ
jgi:hypothetical protein